MNAEDLEYWVEEIDKREEKAIKKMNKSGRKIAIIDLCDVPPEVLMAISEKHHEKLTEGYRYCAEMRRIREERAKANKILSLVKVIEEKGRIEWNEKKIEKIKDRAKVQREKAAAILKEVVAAEERLAKGIIPEYKPDQPKKEEEDGIDEAD